GSGIVHDSSAAEEAAECKIKAHFLTAQPKVFDILETILWDGGYHHLEKHLQRMAGSARYFGYPWDEEHIRARLTAIGAGLASLGTNVKMGGQDRSSIARTPPSPLSTPPISTDVPPRFGAGVSYLDGDDLRTADPLQSLVPE